ncbi:MAG: phosphomannomutase/phosphoglucomutase, partial [Alphaproteobacteria bacterium]|nr:phosphomannomutase/phosphoglucomutase [Alphaproteobacteria bacterium]
MDALRNAHRFDPTSLREYDIRGIVGKTLSAADARAVGRGFGSEVVAKGGRRVAVGRDGRLHSPELSAALIEGLVSCGIEVTDVGMGPSPKLYFATREYGYDGGVMVTGSHNPSDYNGFKMMLGKASFWGEQIQALGRRAAAGDFAVGQGSVIARDVDAAYVERLRRDFRGDRHLTIVWDCGNGAAGPATEALVKTLPGKHIVLNGEVDGTFPAHHPDPTVEKNLEQLKHAVREHRADAGIAFDGDGDRIGVVDGQGRVLWGDQILSVLASDVLAERPGATIIADVKASQALFDEIASMGGKPLMWKTGHSIIKTKMAEIGSPLAGEMSGHIFFADKWYGFDDALYAAIRLLSILARSDRSLAQRRDALPQVMNTPELRFPCPEERKFKVPEEVKARLKAGGARFSDIDGVRVTTPDGWWLLRASNTQDVLVARCEARDAAGLARLKSGLVEALAPS